MRPTCSPVPRVPAVRSRKARCLLSRWPQPHTGSCAPSYRRAYSHFSSAPTHVHYCSSARWVASSPSFCTISAPPQLHTAPLSCPNTLKLARSVCGSARRERLRAPLDLPWRSGIQAARARALLLAALVGCRNGRLSSWPNCHLCHNRLPQCSDPSASLRINRPGSPRPQCSGTADHRPRRARPAHCPQWLSAPPQGPS